MSRAIKMIPTMSASDEERFMAKVQPEPMSGCWLWDAGVTHCGYGQFSVRGVVYRSHRVAYRHWRECPQDNFVCHRCDTPACVNPDHLFLGSNSDNMADMAKKGRGRATSLDRGLAPETVRMMRREVRAGSKVADVARRHGITYVHAWQVVHGFAYTRAEYGLPVPKPSHAPNRPSLSDDQVREVWRLREAHGWGCVRIGRALSISKRVVDAILRGITYRWVRQDGPEMLGARSHQGAS